MNIFKALAQMEKDRKEFENQSKFSEKNKKYQFKQALKSHKKITLKSKIK